MKSDVMEWMINTQLGRRNLPPAQRLAVMDKFKKKIQEQAKSMQGTRTDLTSSPNGEKVKSTHTDKELAKMAGVGAGTVARFNKVMNSDDEILLDLLESNIRRRGEVGGAAKKVEMIGISVDTLQNYKKLTELVPELQDWVETGILAPTTAIALIKYMSPSEQEDFVRSMDIAQKITKREVQQYIDKIKQLNPIKKENDI